MGAPHSTEAQTTAICGAVQRVYICGDWGIPTQSLTNYAGAMSFGFSLGDIITITQLTTQLISRVRRAGAEFRQFEGDLELAQSLFISIEQNWRTYSNRAAATELRENHHVTIQATFTGIRSGLEELRTQLDTRNQMMPGVRQNLSQIRFSYRLAGLRRRLEFHMESMQLIVQNLNLMQGNRIEEAIRLIRDAQDEQERESQARQQNPEEQEWNESLSSFEMRYLPRGGTRASAAGAPSTSTSRDFLIERWRRRVASTSPSSPSPPASFLRETQYEGLQSTSPASPPSFEATSSHSRRNQSETYQTTTAATQVENRTNYSNSPVLASSTTFVSPPSPDQPLSATPRFNLLVLWTFCARALGVLTLLCWIVDFGIAVYINATYDHIYGANQFLNAPDFLPMYGVSQFEDADYKELM